jgi:filamentous hemagglutinin
MGSFIGLTINGPSERLLQDAGASPRNAALGALVIGMVNPAGCAAKLVEALAAKTTFKTAHYASRLEAAGVDIANAEAAVGKEINAMREHMGAGAEVGGRLKVDGVLVEYRARLLPDGTVNVGTLFPVK